MNASSYYRGALMLCGALLGASVFSIYVSYVQRPTTVVFARPQLPLPDYPSPILVKTEEPKPAGKNLALAANGATASGGKTPELLIDGEMTKYRDSLVDGYGMHLIGFDQSFVITLKEKSEINCVRFLLWDVDPTRYYRYKLESSTEAGGDDWAMLVDRTGSENECKGWQNLLFDPRPVKRLRLTGTYNVNHRRFYVVELEVYMNPPPLAVTSHGESNDF